METSDFNFDLLKKYIGEGVTYTGWDYGVVTTNTDILCEVEPYRYVVIGDVKYPFIGYGSAILCIHDIKGKILYSNPNVNEKYNLRDIVLINEKRKESFGDILLYDNYNENTDYNRSEKIALVKEARGILDSITFEEFMYLTEKIVLDANSLLIMKASLDMLQNLDEDTTIMEARRKILDKYNFPDIYEEAFDNLYARFLDVSENTKVLKRL